jgi:tRNA modification GTPase
MNRETIFALSTAHGNSGVAVVRLTGPRAARTLGVLTGRLPPPRKTALRTVLDPRSGETIDQCLVFWHQAPASFTGEDLAEIHTHGSPAVVRLLLGVLGSMQGLRPAEPGEFTRRAFLNGKMSLIEAEGLADLVRANTSRQLRQAVFQTSGVAGAIVSDWGKRVRHALAYVEAALDFAEDVEASDDMARSGLHDAGRVRSEIEAGLGRSGKAERLREGFRVLLAGPPNSGKSSLFNRLVGEEAAIVTPLAGTTRDLLRADLELGGIPVSLIDSAGIRSTEDLIEREGVRRSTEAAGFVDVVIWVLAPDGPMQEPPTLDSPPIQVWNKSDLEAKPPDGFIGISCKSGSGLEELRAALVARLESETGWGEPALVTRARHRRLLQDASLALSSVESGEGPLELKAERLRACLAAFDELMGRTTPEDILDVVFREFCIGK